jgi:hypothetical protein
VHIPPSGRKTIYNEATDALPCIHGPSPRVRRLLAKISRSQTRLAQSGPTLRRARTAVHIAPRTWASASVTLDCPASRKRFCSDVWLRLFAQASRAAPR